MRVIVLAAIVMGLQAPAMACPSGFGSHHDRRIIEVDEELLDIRVVPIREPARIPAIEIGLALFGLACGVLLCRRLAAQ